MRPWSSLFLYYLSLFRASLVEGIVRDALEKEAGVSFSARDFRKGFPLGFKARGVRFFFNGVKGEEGPLDIVEMDDLMVSLAIFPLIIGKKRLDFFIGLGDGIIEGEAFVGEETTVTLNAREVALNAFGELSAMGLKKGSVSGKADFIFAGGNCPKGSVSLDTTGVALAGLTSSYPAFIFGESLSASLAMETEGDCKAEVKGLFIEGEGLDARIEGVMRIKSPIERSALDMKLELFTKPQASGADTNEVLFSIINGYKRSSGYYRMNIKGTINSPVIKK